MDIKKMNARSVSLFVIFVLLIICSVLSFSYSYYSATAANKTNFIVSNTSLDCLSITTNTSTYPVKSASPSTLYPITDTVAISTNGSYPSSSPGFGSSGQPFGQIGFTIHNNCSESLGIDIVFIPTSANQINLGYIRIAKCYESALTTCMTPNGNSNYYTTPYDLCSDGYMLTSSGVFWQYLASTSVGGAAIGGVDQRICSVINPDGYLLPGNSSENFTIRYWIKNGTASSIYNNKTFAGKFVVYTMP